MEGIALGQDFAEVVARRGAPAHTSPFPSEAADSGIGVVTTHIFGLGVRVCVDARDKVVRVRHGHTLELDGKPLGNAGVEMQLILNHLGQPFSRAEGPPLAGSPSPVDYHTYYAAEQELTIYYRDGAVWIFNLSVEC